MANHQSWKRDGELAAMKNIIIYLLASAFMAVSADDLRAQTTVNITDEVQTYTSLENTIVNVYGKSELHITDDTNPITGSQINLYSEDAWLFFDHIRPSMVMRRLMSQIKVLDQDAVPNKNVRVVQYVNGTVIVPHSPDYQPLTVFEDSLYAGASMQIGIYDYYRGSDLLSSMDDAISSFKLKRGYMATFAQQANGTGFSKVYIAQDGDIEIEKLPDELNDQVSFIRVFPWRWANKKGFASDGDNGADTLFSAWRYDWDNDKLSIPNVEYVPMRHNRYWNSYANMNNKRDCTHALAFNEPDRPDQANMTVSAALAEWPNLLQSSLRLGSPATSDGGLSWLYDFIDQADALNYRVDFVAVHYYKGGWSARQFYNWLKEIHERTGRPLWITEWNNGANWTCCEPTYEQQAQIIRQFITMLDTTSFVERYSIYNWVGDTRAMISNFDPIVLTQAGVVYRDDQAPMAYWDPGSIPSAPAGLTAKAASSTQIDLSWVDNATNEAGFRIERKTATTAFTQIARLGANVTTYSDNNLLSLTEYSYRVVAYNSIGDSHYSNMASDTTKAGVGVLPQSGWRLHYVDSQETTGENGAAVNAFDGNPNTFWHTEWYNSNPPHPHEIQINLGDTYLISGLLYLPRQDGNLNGTIADYEIYVSMDGSTWGDAVASGKWASGSTEKEVRFAAVNGQYVRLVALSEVNGREWTSVAELNILVGVDTKVSETNSIDGARPTSFSLSQNYPNPFNMETTIRYEIPYTTQIRLDIYDILGHHIKTLAHTKEQAGSHTVSWDGKNDQGVPVVSGIYLCRLDAGGIGKTIKVQVVK
jgi:hypothetical protein